MSKSNRSRSGEALAALSRNSAGPMRHRLQPRGGSNKLRYDDEMEPFENGAEWWFDEAADRKMSVG